VRFPKSYSEATLSHLHLEEAFQSFQVLISSILQSVLLFLSPLFLSWEMFYLGDLEKEKEKELIMMMNFL